MSYLNAKNILPNHIMTLVQEYVQGETVYIPKSASNRSSWGQHTSTRSDLRRRNMAIMNAYDMGHTTQELAETFYLSIKSIQRIIRNQKHVSQTSE